MADIQKGELQDNLGNTIYPHTESDVVFCSDGQTVQEKLAKTENALGDANGKSGSLEVSDANILATTEATHQLAENQGGCRLSYENGEFYVQAGADAASKKKLGSGSIYKLGTCRETATFSIATIVGSDNVGKYTADNFLVVSGGFSAGAYSGPPSGASASTASASSSLSAITVSYDDATGMVTVSGGSHYLKVSQPRGTDGISEGYVEKTVYFLGDAKIESV